MASITAAAGGGNWTTGGTWVGGVAPTAADDALLTAASGNVTINSGAVCRSLDCNTYTGTLTHTSGVTLTIGDGTAGAGNRALRLVAGMTYTLGSATTSTISFISTSATVQTITTAGKTLAAILLNGVAGSWQLSDALTLGGVSANSITLTNGTFDTNGQTVSCGSFGSSNSNTRTLTLGASTITLNGNGATWNMGTITNLTFNPNTSTIVMANGNMSFSGGGATYNNMSFAAGNGGDFALNGANTFNNLSYSPTTNAIRLVLGASQIVTGTFTAQGASVSNPTLVKTSTLGTQFTITAAVVTISNISFMDVIGAGAGTWSGTNIGNCGNNSGITFRAAANYHWVNFSGGSATSVASWSATDGGAAGTTVPLPQDTMFFNASSITSAGRTITMDLQCVPTLDFTNILNSPTVVVAITNGQVWPTGSLTLISAMTFTPTGFTQFVGRGPANTVTMAGKTFTTGMNINAPGGAYTFTDLFATTGSFTHTNGTLTINAGGQSTSFTSSNSNTRVLTMAGKWTVTGTGNVVNFSTMTGLTLNIGTSRFSLTDTSASSKSIVHGSSLALYDVDITPGGSGAIIFGSNPLSMHSLNLNGGSKTLQFQQGSGSTTTIAPGGWNVNGTAGNLVSITSGTPGSQAYLSVASGVVSGRYLSIIDSNAAGGASFQAINSTDAGNNTGWVFSTQLTNPTTRVGQKFVTFGGNRPYRKALYSDLHHVRKLGGF